MPFKRGSNSRHSARLNEYDYSHPGAYFVTIVTYRRECLLGKIVEGEIELSTFGLIVRNEWFKSVSIRKEIELYDDEFIVMPNHIHGIVWIKVNSKDVGVRATGRSPLRDHHTNKPGPSPKSLSSFVAGYKSSVTKYINQLRKTPGQKIWLRNYHDRIIRNERELNALREYIRDNPLRWELDRENPGLHDAIKQP